MKGYQIQKEYLQYADRVCRELQGDNVRLLAYRKAIGVPSEFTREEAREMMEKKELIID